MWPFKETPSEMITCECCPLLSVSSACAKRHWVVASTTSDVTKLKGCLYTN